MSKSYDVVVAGLGITGCAVAHELARRGVRVLGLDKHVPPHRLGSSHGRSRVIREAYFEDPLYVPLVRQAFDLWFAIEDAAGRHLFTRTGALTVGPTDGPLLRGTLESVHTHDIGYETLTADAVRQRFPTLAPPSGTSALLEKRAGVLLAEPCMDALLDLARRGGAEFQLGEPMLNWRGNRGGVTVRTSAGEIACGRLVLAAGPWTPALLADAGLSVGDGLRIERQVVAFFAHTGSALAAAGRLPIVLWEYGNGGLFYILPDTGFGLKAGIHHEGSPFDPESGDRTVRATDLDRISGLLDQIAPGVRGDQLDASVCLYTNTPDSRFLIDVHPQDPGLVVASACSGHGFKFAPAIARIVADLALGHPTAPEAEPFRWPKE